MSTSTSDRPLRRDAARNRAHILEAAGELFAERGLGATLNDIAHHAGVGVGTVYRHFPDRDVLIETLFQARVDELVEISAAGLTDPDPWRGLVTTLQRSLELQAADRGLRELVQEAPVGVERLIRARERLLPIGTELVRRAQAAGAVHPDIDPGDVPIMQLMTIAVIDASREVDPTLWRRYLALLLRGIATHPDDLPELPDRPPSPEEIDRVMIAGAPRRR